mgnify:CR=1 FL=1
MKTLLIIYPHWPPSNLAGVHRPRLIANFLNDFDWQAIVLTVQHNYYEEPPDFDLCKLVNQQIEVHYTKAHKVTKPRIIGDIGLRAFNYLKKEALEIIKTRKIDFIWIPIPSLYVALLGRVLHNKTKIPYGIDYIDPWVRNISNRKNFRAIFSNFVARILEPMAVKKASLISGVSFEYFKPMLQRNFKNKKIETIAMPYGFDPNDHQVKLNNIPMPWDNYPNCIPIIYAGAVLPLSGYFISLLFKSMKKMLDKNTIDKNIKLFFVGTGNYTHNSIEQYAAEAGIKENVGELRQRFPFLHILNFLSAAKGVMVIGSTEKHYTASKIFQSLLSQQPVFAIMHNQSSVVDILNQCNAKNNLVEYFEQETEIELQNKIEKKFEDFVKNTQQWQPNLSALDKYSAKESTKALVNAIERIV